MTTWYKSKGDIARKHYSELKEYPELLNIRVENINDVENIKKIISFFTYNNDFYTMTGPKIVYLMTIFHLKSLNIELSDDDKIFQLVTEEFIKGCKEKKLLSCFDDINNIKNRAVEELDDYNKTMLMLSDLYYITKERQR